MRFVLLLAPLAFVPRLAHANQCDAGLPATANYEIPSGCALRVYFRAGAPLDQVKLVNSAGDDLTGTVTPLGPIDLPVHYDEPDYNNQCSDLTHVAPYAYDAYDITFTAAVGDLLLPVGGGNRWSMVVAAGECPVPSTFDGSDWIRCSATVQEYDACHDALCTPFATMPCDPGDGDPGDPNDPANDGGCSTSNGASLGALAIGLLAITRRNQQRRSR